MAIETQFWDLSRNLGGKGKNQKKQFLTISSISTYFFNFEKLWTYMRLCRSILNISNSLHAMGRNSNQLLMFFGDTLKNWHGVYLGHRHFSIRMIINLSLFSISLLSNTLLASSLAEELGFRFNNLPKHLSKICGRPCFLVLCWKSIFRHHSR